MTSPNEASTAHSLVDRADLIPDLRDFARMHDAILRDTGRLVDAVDALGSRTDAAALAAWFTRFEMVITHHHEREDDLIFPQLRDVAGLDPDGLGADHVELDRVMEEVSGALAMLHRSATATTEPDEVARGRARQAARELDGLMWRHLTAEESLVFPLIGDRLSPEAWAATKQQIEQGTPFRAVVFTLPWVLDGASTEDRDRILDGIPFVFRAVNALVWERSYRRVAAPVLAVAR